MRRCITIGTLALLAIASSAAAADLAPLLTTIRAVGPNGAGNREAAAAWQTLSRADAAELPVILAALDQANPLAADWLRTAVDAIAERTLQQGGKLPTAELEQFVRQRGHDPRARRLAYEWLVRVDAAAPARLLPGMLDDPSVELRRDAVAKLIDEAAAAAKAGQTAQAATIYQQALTAARDLDQIRLLSQRLRGLGQTVDLPRQFGLVTHWWLIGPFDNVGGKGFDRVFAPEEKVDFAAAGEGKHGRAPWSEHTTKDEYGQVDLNKTLGEEKGVAGYAATEFYLAGDAPRDVEVRYASMNATKLWLNGRLIAAHQVYHGGSQFDQYIARVQLQPGRNLFLLKVCQNEQTQEWARVWGFQFRVCDAAGGAVLSAR